MSIVLVGSTSGSITLQEPAVAGTTVLTLPAVTGNVLTDTSPKAGNVIQVVSTSKLDAFTTTSTSPVDVTGLSVNITPTSSSSKILVLAQIYGGGDSSSAFYVNLVRNSTSLSISTAGSTYNSTMGSYLSSSSLYSTNPVIFLDSPATTSSTTYKIQIFSSGGTVAVNRRVADAVVGGTSSITVMEIAA